MYFNYWLEVDLDWIIRFLGDEQQEGLFIPLKLKLNKNLPFLIILKNKGILFILLKIYLYPSFFLSLK